jgi:hypothetical protein
MCSESNVTMSYTNTITVEGSVVGGPTVTGSDEAYVNVVPPTSVSLSGFGADSGNNAGWLVAVVAAVAGGVVFMVIRRRRREAVA